MLKTLKHQNGLKTLKDGKCGKDSLDIRKKSEISIFCGKIEVNNFGINLVFGTYYGFRATCGLNFRFIGL